MNPDDEPTSQPPDSLEIIDDEVIIEKTLKKKITTFDTPSNKPPFTENEATNEQYKNQERHPNTDVITLKSPVLPEANNTMTQRTIEVATTAVIVNSIITTSITLQLRSSRGSTNLNVLKAHQNIFSAMKLIDPTLKLSHSKTKQSTPQINSLHPQQSTLPSSKMFINILNHPECISRTKSNQQSHLMISNTEINNNSQASSALW